MKVLMNGKQIGEEVTTNRSMTIEEATEYALSLSSIDNQEELEKLYDKGCEAVYFENGRYEVDTESLRMVY